MSEIWTFSNFSFWLTVGTLSGILVYLIINIIKSETTKKIFYNKQFYATLSIVVVLLCIYFSRIIELSYQYKFLLLIFELLLIDIGMSLVRENKIDNFTRLLVMYSLIFNFISGFISNTEIEILKLERRIITLESSTNLVKKIEQSFKMDTTP